MTTGTKTFTDASGHVHTINILRLEGEEGRQSAIYKKTSSGGSPRQEYSMTEAEFISQGWTDV